MDSDSTHSAGARGAFPSSQAAPAVRPGRPGFPWGRPWVAGLVVGLAVTLTSALSLAIVCVAARDVLLDDLRNYLRRTVETTAALIDGDRHARITDSAATGSPEYLALSAPLAAVLEHNPDIRFAYSGFTRGDSMFFVLDGDRTADAAYVMQLDEPTAGELEVSRTRATVVETRPTPSVWGNGIRAFAPIGGRAGREGAYVGITMSAERYYSWVTRVYRMAALGMVVALGLALLAGTRAARVERTRLRAEVEMAGAREMAIATLEDRRAMESRLLGRQKIEALGTLAGGVAHDFNNLLTVILGNAEMIAAEAAPGSLAGESAAAIQAAGGRARDVVRRILIFARPEAECRTDLSLGQVVEETVLLLSTTLPKSIEIVWRPPRQPVMAIADASQLSQALMNLGVNASHALRDQRGTIEFRLALVELGPDEAARLGLEPGACARMDVRDTGIGMCDEVRARILEPFFTTKAVGEGSGLGLAVVEGVVRGHRGAMEVESAVGLGTTFTIYLPASMPVAAAEPAPSPAPLRRDEGKHSTIRDDDPVALALGVAPSPFAQPAGRRTPARRYG